MAVQKRNTATKSAVNEMKKADAFLNLKLVDSEGTVHNLPKGLALFNDNRVMRSLINAAGINADREFTFTGTVYIPAEEQAEDIPL